MVCATSGPAYGAIGGPAGPSKVAVVCPRGPTLT